ncbi:FMN-dependent alpha-hydroxy acid dehydrogenase [Auriculariales sp. MPI-PUGE-AT-0066]|nr:FMN-dependent alpha-hydroxy acid dehydrogenase [Auriculariales sp. MPI-PUGE-AT-0066]
MFSAIFFRAAALAALCGPFVGAVVLDTEGLPDSGLDTSSWVAGEKPPLTDIYNLHDMQLASKNYLGKKEYSYIRTGVLDEYTYHANLDIWKQVKLRPHLHYGRNVANVSLSTTMQGLNFSAPFFLSPTGYSSYTDPDDAELNVVRAAGAQGIVYGPSILTAKSTKEMADARIPGQFLFRQVYPWANETRFKNDIAEAEANGYSAIFLTLDNPTQLGLRTRSLRQGAPDSSGQYSTDRSLKTARAVQSLTKLPVIPKGIISWEDAKLAMQLGFKTIYISNHGGRLLETAPTPIEILLDIHKHAPEVIKHMEIYADGGVRHGSDIAKLLALGVRAVGIGRPTVFANSWKQEGVEKMIKMLRTELTSTLMLLGINDIRQIDRSYINTKVVESWL